MDSVISRTAPEHEPSNGVLLLALVCSHTFLARLGIQKAVAEKIQVLEQVAGLG